MTALRGSSCGEVRFEVDGPLMRSSHCHCHNCISCAKSLCSSSARATPLTERLNLLPGLISSQRLFLHRSAYCGELAPQREQTGDRQTKPRSVRAECAFEKTNVRFRMPVGYDIKANCGAGPI